MNTEIIILPARNCRRSKRVIEYLKAREAPFSEIPLESPQGQALAAEHSLCASPGILVDGASVNPFDILIQPACQVDEDAVKRLLHL